MRTLLLVAVLSVALPSSARGETQARRASASDPGATATAGTAAGAGPRSVGLAPRDVVGSPSDGAGGLARWDTEEIRPDEVAPDADRSVQFATGGAAATVPSVSLARNGVGTTRAGVTYDTDPTFAPPMALADSPASRDDLAASPPAAAVTVPAGDPLYLRAFPSSGGSAAAGESLSQRAAVVERSIASAPASATWVLDATTLQAATTAGALTAPDQATTGEYVVRDYAGSGGSQRVYAPGGAGNGLGYWPNETAANPDRYAQFVVRPQDGTTFAATDLTLRAGNSGGSDRLRMRVSVSADGFETATALADGVALPSSALEDYAYALDAGITEGDSLTVRVYPWLEGGRDSGKYFNLSNVFVGGTTTGDPVVALPTVTTEPVTSVSTTTATSGGTVSSDGGGPVTARGVVYHTAPLPSLANRSTDDGEGVGAFVSELTGLAPGETYYARAYATNSAGTAYGDGVSFTALGELSVPTVTTADPGPVLVTTATLGGAVTFDGGRPVTDRGVCVAPGDTPTTDDDCASAGEGPGTFTVEVGGLAQETAYTARAYAVNDQGTAYGEAVPFTTRAPAPPVEIVVAQDGSGDHATLQEAFDAVPSRYTGPVTIRVRAGVYEEKALLESDKVNVRIVGDGAESTVVRWDDYSGKVVDGTTLGTYTSYTVALDADDLVVQDITFQNTYDGSQAVALRVRGDRVALYDVRLLGFQDTYYTHGYGRIYHQDCYIEGTVDFVFGRSIAVFDDCEIRAKRDDAPVTAANTEAGYAYGYVFRGARLTADEGVEGITLGRPWGPYAQTVFVDSEMGDHIDPAGWRIWSGTENHLTAHYAEGRNTGPGYVPESRVEWSEILPGEEVDALTLEAIFSRESAATPFAADWLPPSRLAVAAEDDPTSSALTALRPVAPNPVRGTATVRFDVAETGEASVEVFDVQGRRVAVLADRPFTAGPHALPFNAAPFAAGVYLVRLRTPTATMTQTLAVVR